MSLDAILSRIANGESVSSSELLPYLCLEGREQRANANRLLAQACWQSGRIDQLRHAQVFIRRAWVLSRFSPELLPLYTQIYSALDDIPGIRDAYKRVGMMMAAQGNVSEAIRYFDLWQYAYWRFRNLDKYEYDFDILECMDRLAQPYRFSPGLRPALLKDGKIRLAYLVRGVTQVGSVLIKVISLFAKYHDRSRFEPVFFVLESERTVRESEAGQEHLRLFESYGCKLVMAPNIRATEERLLAVGRMIYDARPDILIMSAALAGFDHYFITALRPAPVIIGLIQGPPQQFAPLTLNWGIAWSEHPLLDCPVNCALVHLDGDLVKRSELTPNNRAELDIPDDAVLVASAGRHVKFQEPEFWQAIIDLLKDHPESYYLAMGVEESQLPFLAAMLTEEVRSRIRLLSWRGGNDYLRCLCLADILIDTFPSGGGGVLFDAMALGIPVVTFKNNYFKSYDQTDWSPAEEFINISEIIVPRGDFAQMKELVSRLIEDPGYRHELARRCQEDIEQNRGDAERAVRRYEEICIRVLEQECGRALTDPRAAEVAKLARVFPDRKLTARAARQLKRVLRFGERVLDRIAEGRVTLRRGD